MATPSIEPRRAHPIAPDPARRGLAPARRIRLLFLTGYLGYGGSERQMTHLLEALDPGAFECHVAVLNPSPTTTFEGRLRDADVTIWRLPPDCRGLRRRLPFLYRLFRRLAPDIVHSWTTYANAYVALIGRLAGVPVRWGSVRNALSAQGIGDLPVPYRALCLRGVSALVVNAAALRDELLATGYPAHRIHVVPNCVRPAPTGNGAGVDLTSFGIADDNRLIGLIGNIRPQKNPTLFAAAMRDVLPHYADARALIVGQPLPHDRHLHERLAEAAAHAPLAGRLFLTGFRDDVPALLRRLTILCLTSDYEGMPNVVLEAMAAGLPVVVTRAGALPDIIDDGVNGLLAPRGDAAAVARGVRRLLDDPALARTMGENARQTAARYFACDRAAASLTALYRAALGARP